MIETFHNILPCNSTKKHIRSVRDKNLHTRLVSLNDKGDAAGGLLYSDDLFYGIGHGMSNGPKALACIWDAKSKKLISIGKLTNSRYARHVLCRPYRAQT